MIAAPRPYRRAGRVRLVLLALIAYAGIDALMLLTQPASPRWDITVAARGVITSVTYDGPGDSAGLVPGDIVLSRSGASGFDTATRLTVRHHGRIRTVTAAAPFGYSLGGQAMVLAGLLWLLIGGLAWAFSRRRRAPALLAAMSAAAAFALQGAVWELDGAVWAVQVVPIWAAALFPVVWAAFFLTFPSSHWAKRPWRQSFKTLSGLAIAALLAYAAACTGIVPQALAAVVRLPAFPLGCALGLIALASGHAREPARVRQQRRLIGASAAAATLPFLLLSFVPEKLSGHVIVSYDVSALASAFLPCGLAYAIVRYDLMGLDLVVRRLVAAVINGAVLALGAGATALLLRALSPVDGLPLLVIATFAGAMLGRAAGQRTRQVVERLLAPELVRARRLLEDIDAVVARGTTELTELARCLEDAACVSAGAPWARLFVRQRVPGAVYRLAEADATPASLSALTARLARHPWGVGAGESLDTDEATEWATLAGALGPDLALLIPLRLRLDVIGFLAVGERPGDEPLAGPDREALALLASFCALPIDHGRVRAEAEAEGADAAAYSAACAQLTSSLDNREALPGRIVDSLCGLRTIRGAAVLLYDEHGSLSVAAGAGDAAAWPVPADPSAAEFRSDPWPGAWLPLAVGTQPVGALCVRWHDRHVIHEYDRRLLAVLADSAALALDQARLYEQARMQAERDPVTNLFNHRAFHARLDAALDQARETGEPVGLLLIDLVDFKLFNDTHGHQAGDRALQAVAEVLEVCCKGCCCAARLGGDEFAVLLPGHDVDRAREMADQINDLVTFTALALHDNLRVPLRLSIGVAAAPDDADLSRDLLARADACMYEAKRIGKSISTVARAEPGMERADGPGGVELLEGLVAMVDNRDSYTSEHSTQVATYACALGRALGLPDASIETLHLAGLLHDVGKIGVPNRILRKPDRLTDEEMAIVRRHVELSEALLTVLAADQELLDAVRYHHERWDGGGYPRGLAGDAVPLLGRIMIVADAVSAMGMDRPYRTGLSWQTIAQELENGAGRQFDPALVEPELQSLGAHVTAAKAGDARVERSSQRPRHGVADRPGAA